MKALERERQRIEDEIEEKRIREHEQKMKAELEEEERKKKVKEELGKRAADDAKRQADERKTQEGSNRKFANKRATAKNNKFNDAPTSPPSSAFPPPAQGVEFRSDSPPLPTIAKKINGSKPPTSKSTKQNKPADTTADYFVTESRLNLASPVSFEI